MSEQDQWPEVRVVHVYPSGLATLPLPDGTAATVRVTLGHLDAPDGGLLDEVRSGRAPTPWRSAAVREEALTSIATRRDLTEELRARLLRHVGRSPHYVDL